MAVTKVELENFYNEGFGWVCKHCERDMESKTEDGTKSLSRLMSEGEAESKNPTLSNKALAKWADKARRILMCPRCGITELADKF